MSQPTISIIVPVYNVEKYLPQCLDSLVNQTYKNLEIICVNDGSTDGSLEILKKYAEKDSRVKVVSKENEGASVARNAALDMATGTYLMFVDSDDWIELNTCECAIQAMTDYNVDLVMWDYIREFSSGSKPKNIFDCDIVFDEEAVESKLHRRMVGIVGEELRHPENADALCTIWGKLYKAEYILKNKIKFYDIKEIGTYEDGLFNLNVLQHVSKAAYINKLLYHYRKTNIGSVATGYKPRLCEQRRVLFCKLDKYIKKNHCPDIYNEALHNRIALSVLELGLNITKGRFPSKEKIQMIHDIIAEPQYRSVSKKLELKYFPLHWKIFFGCAKHEFAIAVYVLLIAIKRMQTM